MYYLLENNKIYDSNNKRDVSSLEFDFQITIENNQLYKYYDRGNWDCNVACSHAGYRCIGCEDAKKKKIIPKKQSENIYDLIEVGDLIAFKYMDTEAIDIAKVVHIYQFKDGDIDIATRGYIHSTEKIQAIYKPNSKGDYIKVWEKENEQK